MTKTIRPLLLALLALTAALALSGLAATGASASGAEGPEFVPTTGHTFPEAFLGLAGLSQLLTAKSEVHCPEVHITGTILPQPTTTSSMLGDVLFDFLGCTTKDPLTGKADSCNTAGSNTGLIMTPLYLWHLGLLKLPTSNDPVIIILVTKTTFECATSVGKATIEVEGNLVGSIGETGLHRESTITFKSASAGKQEVTEAEVFLPKEIKAGLKLSSTLTTPLGKEPAEEASESAGGKIMTETNEVELVA